MGSVGLPMAEPVADHELQPGGGQGVDRLRGQELLAHQQAPADLARARREHPLGVGYDLIEREIPAEPRARHAHPGLFRVVLTAVERAIARAVDAALIGGGRHGRLDVGVVEISAAQIDADRNQVEEVERGPELIPVIAPVDLVEGIAEKSRKCSHRYHFPRPAARTAGSRRRPEHAVS